MMESIGNSARVAGPGVSSTASALSATITLNARPAPKSMSVGQARQEILSRCQALGLTQGTHDKIVRSLGLDKGKHQLAGPQTHACLKMFGALGKAIQQNPTLSTLERDQFAQSWVALGRRPGARAAFTKLGKNSRFWSLLTPRHRNIVMQQLGKHTLSPRFVEQGISTIMRHHLFASANAVGRSNALTSMCDSVKLLRANTLPDPATMRKQAPALMSKHLGHMKPASRKIMHQQVLAKAEYLQKAFFEYKSGSKSNKLWGDRFVNAYGRDWYKQCLSMILAHSQRSACRSAYKMAGVHRGAKTVCGDN